MKAYKINGQIIYANKISDAIKTIKDLINDEDKYFRVRYGHEGDPIAWTSVVIVKANSEGEAARKFNNKWKGYKIFSVTEGVPEGIDEMKRRGMTILDETEVDYCQDEDDLGDRIAKYQKWVDYDMEKYHKISEDTMKMIKEAGLSVTKDQYGEYEVIAHSTEDSVKDSAASDIVREIKSKYPQVQISFENVHGSFFDRVDLTFRNYPGEGMKNPFDTSDPRYKELANWKKFLLYLHKKYMNKPAGPSALHRKGDGLELVTFKDSTKDSVDETGIVSQKLSTPRGTFYIYRGTYRDFRRESDFDDWGLWFEHVEDDGSYYRIMHRAKDNHAIAVKVR